MWKLIHIVMADYDCSESQVRIKQKMVHGEKYFDLELVEKLFLYLEKKNYPESFAFENVKFYNSCLQLHYNFGNHVIKLSHYAFKMYKKSAFKE